MQSLFSRQLSCQRCRTPTFTFSDDDYRHPSSVAKEGRGEEEKKRGRKHSVRNIISPSRRIFNFLESSVKLKRILRERIRFASSRAGFLLTNCEKPCYMNKTLRCRLFHGYVHRSIWEGAFCLPKRGHHRLLLARSAPFYAILASKQVSRE